MRLRSPDALTTLTMSAARRAVTISATTEQAIRAHRVRQAETRLAAGERYADHDLVFASATGTPPDIRSLTRRHFTPLLKTAKVPVVRLAVRPSAYSCVGLARQWSAGEGGE